MATSIKGIQVSASEGEGVGVGGGELDFNKEPDHDKKEAMDKEWDDVEGGHHYALRVFSFFVLTLNRNGKK